MQIRRGVSWSWAVLAVCGVSEAGAAELVDREAVSARDQPLDRWRVHVGDDAAWRQPDWPDGDWPIVHPFFRDAPEGFRGIAWFRTEIDVAPDLVGVPLALWFRHNGAIEVFIEGELVEARGDPGRVSRDAAPSPVELGSTKPIPFEPERSGVHAIAVRFAVERPGLLEWLGDSMGFEASLGELQSSIERTVEQRRWVDMTIFGFVGMTFAVMSLHFFLFFYDRRVRIHLHLAFLALSMGALTLSTLTHQLSGTTGHFLIGNAVMRIAVMATALQWLHFTYEAMKEPETWWFRGFVLAGIVLGLFSFFVPLWVVYAMVASTLIDEVRVLRRVRHRRIPGVSVFVFGVALAAGLSMVQMTLDLATAYEFEFVYLVGFTGFLLTSSLYVARQVSQSRADFAVEVRNNLFEQRRAHEDELRALERRRRAQVEQLRAEHDAERRRFERELATARSELARAMARLVSQARPAALGRSLARVADSVDPALRALKSAHRDLRATAEAFATRVGTDPEWTTVAEEMSVSTRVADRYVLELEGWLRRVRGGDGVDDALSTCDPWRVAEDAVAQVELGLGPEISVQLGGEPVPPIAAFPRSLTQLFVDAIEDAAADLAGPGVVRVRLGTVDRDARAWVELSVEPVSRRPVERAGPPDEIARFELARRIVQQHHGELVADAGGPIRVRLPLDLDARLGMQRGGQATQFG